MLVSTGPSQDRPNIKNQAVQACRCLKGGRRGSDVLHFDWPVTGLDLLCVKGEKFENFDHYAEQETPDPPKETCLTEVRNYPRMGLKNVPGLCEGCRKFESKHGYLC